MVRTILIVIVTVIVLATGTYAVWTHQTKSNRASIKEPQVFADWRVDCREMNQQVQCVASQRVMEGERNNRLLQLEVTETADGRLSLTAITPLGVWIEPGVVIQVGVAEAAYRFPLSYERCLATGCIANTEVEVPLLNALSSNAEAALLVAGKNRQLVSIPFSLRGFGEARQSLSQSGQLREDPSVFQFIAGLFGANSNEDSNP